MLDLQITPEQDGCHGSCSSGKRRESDISLDKIDIVRQSSRSALRYIRPLLDTAKFGAAVRIHADVSLFTSLSFCFGRHCHSSG
jgi:hypothetical protein